MSLSVSDEKISTQHTHTNTTDDDTDNDDDKVEEEAEAAAAAAARSAANRCAAYLRATQKQQMCESSNNNNALTMRVTLYIYVCMFVLSLLMCNIVFYHVFYSRTFGFSQICNEMHLNI